MPYNIEVSKRYYRKHRKKILKQKKEYHLKNREKHLEYLRKYNYENRGKHLEYGKEYYKLNREKYRKWAREYQKRRRANPKNKLNDSISRLIMYSINNNKSGIRWEFLVGYTLKDLTKHLEKQFTPEMSWGNYGSYWHLDHIVPISVFNFDHYNQSDFKRC